VSTERPNDEHPNDDERLLRELADAVDSRHEVPARFLEVGREAFTWHGIDYELAALSQDSAVSGMPAGVRADTAAMRLLTFVAGELAIELEISPDALEGQVIPPQQGSAELRVSDADVRAVAVDDTGWFEFRPPPTRPFRLCLRTDDGRVVLTTPIRP
jgi:hypothetical protein